jgi:adenosylcobinamide-GDP ribazoletransferase
MLTRSLRQALLALQFFTRVPLPARLARWVGFDAALLRGVLVHWPLAGLVVGLLAAVVLWGLAGLLPPVPAAAWVAATLASAAGVCLTGALHEDGLADTADALGAPVGRERALAIMRDVHLGSFGVLALLLVSGARIGLLASLLALDRVWAVATLVAAAVLSRAVALLPAVTLPYVGEQTRSKSFALLAGARPVWLLGAAAWPVLVLGVSAYILPSWAWAAAVAAAVLVALLMRAWLYRRLGGMTGDTLGATQQLAELAACVAVAAVAWRA